MTKTRKALADPETCSLCLVEVEDSELRTVTNNNPHIYAGARICRSCRNGHPLIETEK